MSEREYFEHESENSFDENEYNVNRQSWLI